MKKLFFSLMILISTLFETRACLNGESKMLKDNTFLYEDMEGNVPYGHIFNGDEGLEIGIRRLDSLYKATKDLDYLSDKGLLLILLKQTDAAIKLYLEIEKLSPNRYSTASNIGTAYELIGDDKNALKWIKRSIEIDEKSHNGSEWIHVKILEAKINGNNSINTSFLLNTDFGNDSIPRSKLTKDELLKLSNSLYFQLNERVSFVAPKEKIVAQLLFDLGNIAYLIGNYGDAVSDYWQAINYGFENKIIETRIKLSDREIQRISLEKRKKILAALTPKTINYSIYIGLGFMLLLSIFIAIFVFKNKR